MASKEVVLAMVLGLSLFWNVAHGYEMENKPNNYPNFEFQESPVTEAADVKPHNYPGEFQFSEEKQGSGAANREYKPNNYPDFKFTESPGFEKSKEAQDSTDNVHDQFAQGHHNSFSTVPDARSRFPASNNQFSSQTYSAQDNYVYNAHQGTQSYTLDVPEFRGSDASNRYASSYDLVNSRDQASKGFGSFTNTEVRFTSHPDHRSSSVSESRSTRFYTPASDPDFAFRFSKPDSTYGDNAFQDDNKADSTVYSQFKFDNSDATNDPTATYGSTSPVLAANDIKKRTVITGGHGCANMYWAEHTKQWPSFFNVNTQVAQAFGMKAGDVYGTTTLLQALYDNRPDGYSQLLSHGTASLLNAYTKPNYSLRHDVVIDQFIGALSSRTAAAAQGQKFLNANHAYGPNECLN